jgi:type 1 glutamine amidotransferase
MKSWPRLFLVLPWICSGLGTAVEAQEPPRPIRALLVIGGCCHDYATQKELLTRGISRRAHVEWTIAYDPDTTTRHKNPVYDNPDWARGFDVVVHDECSSDVSDKATIERILRPHRNGLPGVVLHCAMHSYRTEGWNRNRATPWMQFTGLISTGHGLQQPIAVSYPDRDSPITRPLADWTTVDEELYNNAAGRLEPTAHALALGKQGRAGSIVAWTNTYNAQARVFGTTLGHNNQTVGDPRYLDLVTRGLLWAVDRLEVRYLKTAAELVPEDNSRDAAVVVGKDIEKRARGTFSVRPIGAFDPLTIEDLASSPAHLESLSSPYPKSCRLREIDATIRTGVRGRARPVGRSRCG